MESMSEHALKKPNRQPLMSVLFEFDRWQMPMKIRQVERMISNLQRLCPEAGISYNKKAVTDELVILTLTKKS
jgi:hypothetical protein